MYAVLDLGSNSFHLIVAEKRDGKISILKTMNNKVQLADGLSQTGKISRESRERAISTLKEFRELLSGYPITYLCVVGTNTFREAKNAAKFIQDINALGFPVNVISGVQEAFYIYQGAQSFLPVSSKQRLIFDIGGGSTEFAIGNQPEPLVVDSLPIGCVTYRSADSSDQRDEKITRKSLGKIRRDVHKILDEKLNPEFYELDWEEAYASSGTGKMLSAVLRENNLTDGTITQRALIDLEKIAVDLGSTFSLSRLSGLKANRRTVFVSGLAIMQSIMDHLGIDHVDYSDFALREGVLLGMSKQGRDFPLYSLTSTDNSNRLI